MHAFIGSSVEQREYRSKAAVGGSVEEANRKEEGEGVAYLRQTFSELFLVAGSRNTNGQQQQQLAAVEQESKWLLSVQGKQRKLTGNRKRKKRGCCPSWSRRKTATTTGGFWQETMEMKGRADTSSMARNHHFW